MYMRRIFSLIAVTLASVFVATAEAQVGAAPSIGFDPYGTFQSSEVDHVNLSNGNVVVRIPLFSLPQRGAFKPITYSIFANTMPWTAQLLPDTAGGAGYNVTYQMSPETQILSDAPPEFPVAGGNSTYLDSSANLKTVTNWSIQDYSGASHALVYNWADPSELRTIDGSGYRLKYDGGSTYQNTHTYDPERGYNDPAWPTISWPNETVYTSSGITHVAAPLYRACL